MRMGRLVLLVAIFVVAYTPTINAARVKLNKDGRRVIGGVPASVAGVPWMAALLSTTRGNTFLNIPGRVVFRCTASILATRFVLTAAHCFANKTFPINKVRCGTDEIAALPWFAQTVDVKSVAVHPNYTVKGWNGPIPHGSFLNDIAIIRVNEDIQFDKSDNVKPVTLSLSEPEGGQIAMFTGWGRQTKPEAFLGNRRLRGLYAIILDSQECKNKLMYSYVKDLHICALNNQSGVCFGDSGGPLMVGKPPLSVNSADTKNIKLLQVGISSLMSGSCINLNNPDYFTSIINYKEWIDAETDGKALWDCQLE